MAYQILSGSDKLSSDPVKGVINKGEMLEALDARRKTLFWTLLGLSCVGIVLSVIEVEILWDNSNAPDIGCQMLKLFVSLSTLALFYFLLRYYSLLFEIVEVQGKSISGATFIQAFVLSGLLKPFLIDAVVCLIHPLPFVNYVITFESRGKFYFYSSDSFIAVLMMARFYLFFPRLVAQLSGLYNQKSRLIGLMNNVDVSVQFVTRHLLSNSLSVLASGFCLVLFTLSYAMVIFERPLGDKTNLGYFENSLWVVIITMTTIGYGDTYPRSPLGRGVAIIAAFFSICLIALSVNAVTHRLHLSRDEEKTIELLKGIKDKQERKHLAAKLIQRGLQAYKKLRKDTLSGPDSLKPGKKRITSNPQFAEAAHSFKEARMQGMSICTDVPLMLAENTTKVNRIEDRVQNIERKMTEIHSMLRGLAGGGFRTVSADY